MSWIAKYATHFADQTDASNMDMELIESAYPRPNQEEWAFVEYDCVFISTEFYVTAVVKYAVLMLNLSVDSTHGRQNLVKGSSQYLLKFQFCNGTNPSFMPHLWVRQLSVC